MKRFAATLLALLLLLVASLSVAAERARYMVDEIRLNAMRTEVAKWDMEPPLPEVVDDSLANLQTIMGNASQCVAATEEELSQVVEKTKIIGKPDSTEDAELTRRLNALETKQKNLQQRLAICRLLNLSARELQKRVLIWRQKNFTNALLARQQPVWEAIMELPAVLANPQGLFFFKPSTPPDTNLMLLAGFFSLLFLIPLVITLERWIKGWYAKNPDLVRQKAAIMLTRRMPVIAILISMASGFYAGGIIILAAPLGALAVALSLSPLVERFFCKETLGVPASFPIRVLITLILLTEALFFSRLGALIPQSLAVFFRSVVMLLLLGAAMRTLWVLSQHPRLPLLKSFRHPLSFCLAFGPVTEWIGYRNLSTFATYGIWGTLTGGLAAWALFLGIYKLQEVLEHVPAEKPVEKLRDFLGYKPAEHIKGLKLISGGLTLVLVLGYGFLFLRIWGLTTIHNITLQTLFFQGFHVGSTVIIPVKIFLAIFLFFLILNISRWLKRQMGERWLVHTSLDLGARQSITTLTGYVLIGFALFYCLSIAGLDFKNLAIIAGALSVGIGFGLQNIVNNFVSGLILLFERPVRPGDWVVVGETEGYVKRVSIRFTQIQTFNRADVLVPNSDLISNQVTNWMLGDPFGRIVVSVGVAYGTDTRKVHDILMQIAEDHPMVLTNGRLVPQPRVLFTAFGESSLDFELRCHIRDIDHRMSVQSELLFTIDDAFKKEGIEIPFPQRVVHQPRPCEPEEPDPPEAPRTSPAVTPSGKTI